MFKKTYGMPGIFEAPDKILFAKWNHSPYADL